MNAEPKIKSPEHYRRLELTFLGWWYVFMFLVLVCLFAIDELDKPELGYWFGWFYLALGIICLRARGGIHER